MFVNLGIQWAGTLLGCLAAIMVPIPVAFYLYGAKLRARSQFSPTMMLKPPPEDDTTDDETGAVVVAGAPAMVEGQDLDGRTAEKVGNNRKMGS